MTKGSFLVETSELRTQVTYITHSMLLMKDPDRFWLTEVFVILVGLVIVGMRPTSRLFLDEVICGTVLTTLQEIQIVI